MARQEARDSGKTTIQAAQDYIAAHSAEKFSLRAVADALFINASYLERLFKSRTGRTLLEYHNAMRCERAQTLLCQPGVSVSEAGEAAGFVSSSHFSHVFKKVVGVTPTEYRNARGRRAGGE